MNILKVNTEKRRLGTLGERAAARYLFFHGYFIKARNYTGGKGFDLPEIDIIAQKGDTVAYVEVKTRTLGAENPNEPRPASAVTPEKQRKIIQTAAFHKSWNAKGKKMRFDIIEVYVENKNGKAKVCDIKHLQGAFTKDTAYRRR